MKAWLQRALLSLVVLGTPQLARAQDHPCIPKVEEWVRRAATELHIAIEPVACFPGGTRLRLVPRDAPPIDVEVAESPGPAFRHAGRLRVSPVVDVPDYLNLPAGQRREYEALLAWLTAEEASIDPLWMAPRTHGRTRPRGREDRPDRDGERTSRGDRTGDAAPDGPAFSDAALLFGAVLLVVASARRRDRSWRRSARTLGLLFGVGLALRLGLGLWGPLHVNGQGPLWIRAAVARAQEVVDYGPGYPEVMGLLVRVLPLAPDHALFAVNAVLSALAPMLLFGLARSMRLDPHRALAASVLLTLDAISIRLATTESYFWPILTLVLATALLLARAADAQRRRERWRIVASLLAAGLLGAQAARIHPVAWIPLALAPLVLLGVSDSRRDVLRRVAVTVAGAVALALCIAAINHDWLFESLSSAGSQGPLRAFRLEDWASGSGRWLPRIAIVAAAALLWARPRAPVLVGVASAVALLITRDMFAQSDVWRASYDRVLAPAIVLGVVAAVPRTVFRKPWHAVVGAGGCAALVAALQVGAVATVTTEQQEYWFLREHLARIPLGCHIAHAERVGDRIVEIPDYVAPGSGGVFGVQSPGDLVMAGRGRCVYWVRTSLCSTRVGQGLCDDAEQRVVLREVARAELPAVPSYRGFGYVTDPVSVALFEVAQSH